MADSKDKLLSNVDIQAGNGCWIWKGCIDAYGYGSIRFNGKVQKAHRVSYLIHNGPIPEGFILDHTCHDPSTCNGGIECPHRRCVHPNHLKPVTRQYNSSRERNRGVSYFGNFNRLKTHCPQGHEYSPENTSIDARDGSRRCLRCKREKWHSKYKLRVK